MSGQVERREDHVHVRLPDCIQVFTVQEARDLLDGLAAALTPPQPSSSAGEVLQVGHVRKDVLNLPDYDLKILLSGFPAHSYRCTRSWAQRVNIRREDYDPAERVKNECLDAVCDCGTDGRYARYLEDQLAAQQPGPELTVRPLSLQEMIDQEAPKWAGTEGGES